MLEPCPPCITVLPNTFIDGLSGREVKKGYNGEPRIKCESKGEFQIHQDVFGGCPGGCRPVGANGFSIVGLPDPPEHPNGENKILPPGNKWPPEDWPTEANRPDHFQKGVPTVIPPWAEHENGENGDDDNDGPSGGGGGPGGFAAPLSAQAQAPAQAEPAPRRSRTKK